MSAPVTGPPPVLVACGLLRGDQHAYRCRSCGFESDDLSAFGTVSCWDCTERSAWSEQCQAGSCRQCVPAEPGDCAHECHDGTMSSPARSEGPAPGAGEPAASTGAAAGPGGVPAEPVTPRVPARSAPHVPGGLTLRRGPSSPGTGLSWPAEAAPREWDVPLIAGIGAEWIAVLTFALVKNARVPRLARVGPLKAVFDDLPAVTRHDLAQSGFTRMPRPPKSACYFCPFHRPETWHNQRRDEPDLFAKSCDLEDLLNGRRDVLGKDHVFLTRFARPLRVAIPDGVDLLPIFDADDSNCDNGWCMT